MIHKSTRCVGLVFILASINSFAGNGPTSIGSIKIGMSKAEYVKAIEIDPTDCNSIEGDATEDGDTRRYPMTSLDPEEKTLCRSFKFSETGSVETIQVGALSYDVIEADYSASKIVSSFAHQSKAIFFKDKLISIELDTPEVALKTLATKYGTPKLVDKTRTEVCQNGMGNKFKNIVGTKDFYWINGQVTATYRVELSGPTKTCTDGYVFNYYKLQDTKKLKLITDAIVKYKKSIPKDPKDESPF